MFTGGADASIFANATGDATAVIAIVPATVARAVLFNDATMAPLGAPTVEVVTVAKQDLKAGQTIDGLGGYDTYAVAERADVTIEFGKPRLMRDDWKRVFSWE